ncbi:UNVERIFIED_CONTAM: hypothetical protein Slati_0145900 [Sesamum latifolium]|uniref:Integrase catalytic domain-containing protein n=1 Tax=Sesamum latifolium TaxID=2727402 RepID=A0AAW2Y9R8_9LAMI
MTSYLADSIPTHQGSFYTNSFAISNRISVSPDAPPVELSLNLLGTIQQMITSAIREQLAVLVPARVTTPSEVTVPEQADPASAIPRSNAVERPATQLSTQTGDVPPQWLARLEYLQKGLQDVQYQSMMAPPIHMSTCPDLRMQLCCTGSTGKPNWAFFSIRQKEGEPLKEYLQRFNTAALEVPLATKEVKASAFAQGLLVENFFKSLAKKLATKFDALLARAAKYINMEDAQASKREGRGEKRKKNKDKGPSKKPKTGFKDKKPAWQRVNAVYTPLTILITQALMAVEGKVLLSRLRTYKDGPQRPKSDKFCQFHNDYGHTTKECRHLKNEIERLIQNDYLQEYICWEKARGTRPYQKYETDKDKNLKNPSPDSPVKDIRRSSMTGKAEVNDPPRKGVIRMIVGGPTGETDKGSERHRGKERGLEETPGEENSNKRGKDPMPRPEPKEEALIIVQPMEELLIVELIPGDLGKDLEGIDPGKQDVRYLVNKCEKCQKHATRIHQPAEPLNVMLSPCPFSQWGMDIVGPFLLSPGQRKFLLVANDYFTKWVEAEPLCRINEGKVMKFVWNNIVWHFGLP